MLYLLRYLLGHYLDICQSAELSSATVYSQQVKRGLAGRQPKQATAALLLLYLAI